VGLQGTRARLRAGGHKQLLRHGRRWKAACQQADRSQQTLLIKTSPREADVGKSFKD